MTVVFRSFSQPIIGEETLQQLFLKSQKLRNTFKKRNRLVALIIGLILQNKNKQIKGEN